MQRHGRKAWYCHLPHPDVVHLHFFSHTWFAGNRVHGIGFLDEPEAVRYDAPAQSIALVVSY